jgi:hypothetical protein
MMRRCVPLILLVLLLVIVIDPLARNFRLDHEQEHEHEHD